MSLRRVLALLFASAAASFGQAGALPRGPLHVRGSVIDSTTRQAIPNARVQMKNGGSATTSANGNYDIQVPQSGSYDLTVEALGYLPELDRYSAVLTGEYDSVTVDLQMYRPGMITGRLLDTETRKPIAGMRVSTGRVSFRLGRASIESPAPLLLLPGPGTNPPPSLSQARSGQTDKEGFFRIESLRPGTYSLSFPSVDERVLNSDKPPSPAATRGYRRQRWPSTGASAGVELRAGNTLELGDIFLAQEPLYRITGVLTGCATGDDLSRGLMLTTRDRGVTGGAVAPVACGERFSAENLSPGEYLFDLNFEGVGQIRVGQVTVVNRDVEYSPVLSLPLTITGSVIVPENFPAAQLMVGTIPGRTPVKVAPDGKFEMTQAIGEPVEVRVESLPPPFYVSEILFNGAPIRDGMLEVNPYSVVRELKIRIAADGARFTGTVRKDDKLAPNSSVILLAWPERLKNGFPVHYLMNAPYGQFTFSAVPPGSYRAIAVERQAWETELQKPGVLSGLASAGAQVDLAPSAARELTLEVRWIQLSQ